MKAITIQQPFASLIIAGIKTLETRSWPTLHRGPLAIHVGRASTLPEEIVLAGYRLLKAIGITTADAIMLSGKIIGQVTVTDCLHANLADHLITNDDSRVGIFTHDNFVWVLRKPIEYETPTAHKGKLGIWDISPLAHPVTH